MMRKADLPGHWDDTLLRQVSLKTESMDPGKNPDQSFAYVDVSSVSNKSYTIEETQKLLGKDAPSRARKLLRRDDIIFATVRPTLRRVAVVPAWLDGQICSTGYCVIRPDPKRLLPAYAYYYLLTETVSQRVEAMQKGATYPAISDDDLLGLSIPLPLLPEQRAIAHVLRAVQAAREARQREVSLERERKAALMAHLFTHGTRDEPTKQTPIGEVPLRWEVRTFGELTDIQAGGTPSRLRPDYYGGTIQWVKTLDLNDSVVVDTGEKITEAGLQSIRAMYVLRKRTPGRS
jgi:type I restriction enzyme S subunit